MRRSVAIWAAVVVDFPNTVLIGTKRRRMPRAELRKNTPGFARERSFRTMNFRRTGTEDAITLIVPDSVSNSVCVKTIFSRVVQQLRKGAMMEKRIDDRTEFTSERWLHISRPVRKINHSMRRVMTTGGTR